MIYRPPKKTLNFLYFWPQAILLAVLALLILFARARGSFENIVLRAIRWAMPEREIVAEGRSNLILLNRLKYLEEENKKLFSALSMNKNTRMLPAHVVFGGGYIFSDILLADQGSDFGIKIGDAVFAPDNIFVGRVSEVGGNWSKILPITALGEKNILRGGADKSIILNAEGMGAGELGGSLPLSIELLPGEIFWWGQNLGAPAALVDKISKNEASPITDVVLISPVNLMNLKDIFIFSQ